MKSTVINTLKYTGMVTLSQYIGTKKVKLVQKHNRGGNALFNFLTDCLVGDFTKAKAASPNKIVLLGKGTDEEYIPKSGVIYLLSPAEKFYDEDEGWKVRYSFMVPKDQVEATTFIDLSIGLYNSTFDDKTGNLLNYVALFELDPKEVPSVLTNTALVIDWELSISNGADE